MEKILKLLYDKSIKNNIINLGDIIEITEYLINYKRLDDYIVDLDIKSLQKNKLASYSVLSKKIMIYVDTVELMMNDIEENILIANDFEKSLYKNLSIIQVLLHEIEHANQQKLAYKDNSLEALIIRMSYNCNLNSLYNEKLYEYCPEERFAEIKSFNGLTTLIEPISSKLYFIPEIMKAETSQRMLRGYHYNKRKVISPFINYFKLANKEEYLNFFDWYSNDYIKCYDQVSNQYILNSRLEYGFPINTKEYSISMNELVLSLNKNFNKRTNIKL